MGLPASYEHGNLSFRADMHCLFENSEVLYSSPSLHRDTQRSRQAASIGNVSGEVIRQLHTLLQEQAARPGELQ